LSSQNPLLSLRTLTRFLESKRGAHVTFSEKIKRWPRESARFRETSRSTAYSRFMAPSRPLSLNMIASVVFGKGRGSTRAVLKSNLAPNIDHKNQKIDLRVIVLSKTPQERSPYQKCLRRRPAWISGSLKNKIVEFCFAFSQYRQYHINQHEDYKCRVTDVFGELTNSFNYKLW